MLLNRLERAEKTAADANFKEGKETPLDKTPVKSGEIIIILTVSNWINLSHLTPQFVVVQV